MAFDGGRRKDLRSAHQPTMPSCASRLPKPATRSANPGNVKLSNRLLLARDMDHRADAPGRDPRGNHSTQKKYSMRHASVAFGFFLLASLPASIALAQQHAHGASTATISAAPTQHYATDATLREQMRAIRENVLALEHPGSGNVTKDLAVQTADRITGHVNTIIINCKLPPDADAALHNIIGSLLQHASALKADPGRSGAVAGMRKALDQYARTFDDPGFAQSKD